MFGDLPWKKSHEEVSKMGGLLRCSTMPLWVKKFLKYFA
jgi:hypothetical protein